MVSAMMIAANNRKIAPKRKATEKPCTAANAGSALPSEVWLAAKEVDAVTATVLRRAAPSEPPIC